jgi:competence protein ComEC
MPAHGPPRPPVPATAGLRLAGGMLAWLVGNALQLQQPALWPAAAYAALLAGAMLAAYCGRRGRAPGSGRWARSGLRLLVIGGSLAVAAFAITGLRAGPRLHDRLPAALEGQDLQLTGTVVGLPQPGPEGVRFQFEIESGGTADRRWRCRGG